MSYVECAVCGGHFQYINSLHLRKHGLTMAEYRQRYPQAPLQSADFRKKQSVAQAARVFHRVCSCGRPFVTRACNGRFCPRCSHANTRLMQNKPKNGTFNKNYLEVSKGGRINGAVLLEKGVTINRSGRFNGLKSLLQKFSGFIAEFDYVVLCGKIYCSECGSPIIIARENQYYTIPAEPCCKNCGVVYQLA